MPYFRRSRRTYRRRRRLTKAGILANRSARSQSRQIARLNSKVNHISRTLRPDTRTMFKNFSFNFTNGSLNENWAYEYLMPWGTSYTGDDQASGSLSIEGNFVRCKGISIKMIAQYADNWRDTIADEAHDPSAGYRVVIAQRKDSVMPNASSPAIQVSDIFNVTSSLNSDDTNLTTPLVAGIGSFWKVLYARVFTISREHPTRSHNIYIPESKCLNFTRQVNITTSSSVGSGRVYVFILSGGLHHDIDYNAKIKIAGTLKIAFTDS